MKIRYVSFFLILLFTADILCLSGCTGGENSHVDINIEYTDQYQNLEELTTAADLIITGTIMSSEPVDPETEQAAESGLRRTISVLRPYKVLKGIPGPDGPEIRVSQPGAEGWGAEVGNPLFFKGEECFLFLRLDDEGTYHLLHSYARFRVDNGKISSMNFVLPAGESLPPIDLMFRNVELETFIQLVEETIAISPVTIREEEPAIYVSLFHIMQGKGFELYIYEDGEVLYIKEWNRRLPGYNYPPTRSWSTGKMPEMAFTEIETLLRSDGFGQLIDSYRSSREGENATVVKSLSLRGDMTYHIRIDLGEIHQDIYASSFTTPDDGKTFPDMPAPLDDLYAMLRSIGENDTTEVHRDIIGRTITYDFPEDYDG